MPQNDFLKIDIFSFYLQVLHNVNTSTPTKVKRAMCVHMTPLRLIVSRPSTPFYTSARSKCLKLYAL